MDFSKIPIEIQKAWLYESYQNKAITKREYEEDVKELEART